jgi:hypothetical protein
MHKAQTRICSNVASKIARAAVLLINKVSCSPSCATVSCSRSGGLHGSQWQEQEHQSPVISTYRVLAGLLLDLVTVLITDVHGKWTAGPAPLASGARLFSRHCKGAPATPFPPLQIQMASITTASPINCFAPVKYWQNSPKCRSLGCGLQPGGAVKRTFAITLQSFKALFLATPYEQFNSLFWIDRQDAMRVIYFERCCPEQRPRGAGGAALVAPKQARSPPRATPAVTPETAKSPREGERVPPHLWLDWATIRFRFIGPNSGYIGSFCVFGPVLSSPAHGTSSLAMEQI